MASLSAEDRFNIEVIKLLLQIAWSDRQVSPKERLVILAMGRSWSVPEGELHTLLDLLQAGVGVLRHGVVGPGAQDLAELLHLGPERQQLGVGVRVETRVRVRACAGDEPGRRQRP